MDRKVRGATKKVQCARRSAAGSAAALSSTRARSPTARTKRPTPRRSKRASKARSSVGRFYDSTKTASLSRRPTITNAFARGARARGAPKCRASTSTPGSPSAPAIARRSNASVATARARPSRSSVSRFGPMAALPTAFAKPARGELRTSSFRRCIFGRALPRSCLPLATRSCASPVSLRQAQRGERSSCPGKRVRRSPARRRRRSERERRRVRGPRLPRLPLHERPRARASGAASGRASPRASLRKRRYLEDVLACPCGGRRRILSAISEREVIVALLAHLGRPTEPQPIARARAPSEGSA